MAPRAGRTWGALLRPGGHGLGRRARRLVLHGGEDRNDTWVFAGGVWRELTGGARPPSGTGGMCATPEGVYLISQRELWRLDGDAWQKVGEDAAWAALTLLHDPKRGQLWSIADGKVATFEDGRFRPVAELPERVSVPSYTFSESDAVGLDGPRDQLVALSEAGTFVLPLAACGVGPGALPR